MATSESAPRRRTSEDVYEQLRLRIIENRIAPGERVNIDALARELGVSQTPVREALSRLEGDKLVVKVDGRGYTTAALLDLAGLRDLFEFRLLVDVWAARAVAVDRLSNPAPEIDAEVEHFRRLRSGPQVPPRDLVDHDTRFHGLIVGSTGNEVIREAYEQRHTPLHTFRLYSAGADVGATLAEHSRIAQAIRACDPDGAAAAMRDHVLAGYRRFAQVFGGSAAGAALREGGPDRMF